MPFQFDNLWMSAWKGKQCICKREFAQKLQIYHLFQIRFCAWGIIGGLVHSCKYRIVQLYSPTAVVCFRWKLEETKDKDVQWISRFEHFKTVGSQWSHCGITLGGGRFESTGQVGQLRQADSARALCTCGMSSTAALTSTPCQTWACNNWHSWFACKWYSEISVLSGLEFPMCHLYNIQGKTLDNFVGQTTRMASVFAEDWLRIKGSHSQDKEIQSSLDTIWILCCCFVASLMHAGFAMLETGLESPIFCHVLGMWLRHIVACVFAIWLLSIVYLANISLSSRAFRKLVQDLADYVVECAWFCSRGSSFTQGAIPTRCMSLSRHLSWEAGPCVALVLGHIISNMLGLLGHRLLQSTQCFKPSLEECDEYVCW